MTARPLCVLVRLGIAAALLSATPDKGGAQNVDAPATTDETVAAIKAEGFERSEVLEIASWLTDVHGPRLTGSPITTAAAEWVLFRFDEWGLDRPRLERWGPFGRSWMNERTVVHVTAPVPFPVIAHPNAWTVGTDGPVRGPVRRAPLSEGARQEDLEPHRRTLEGSILLIAPEPDLPVLFEEQARRLSTDELEELARYQPRADSPVRFPGDAADGDEASDSPTLLTAADLRSFYAEEGVAGLLSTTSRPPGGGVVFSSGGGAMIRSDSPPSPPVLSVAAEHYGRIVRTLDKGISVEMELDIQNRLSDEYVDGFNILTEISGDGAAEEVVTIGAHFDSWHMATGATDNAAGSAVVMEAMRILKAVGAPLQRTVRAALWTGEEQGLLGSRVHVLRRYGSADAPTDAHRSFSLYLNLDNGAGAIRGVSLQGNRDARPIFDEWMEWVDSDSISVRHTSLRHAGGTDHLSFDRAGLPGFQFIQDPLEYGARTHHSSMDTFDRLLEEDLRHNAVVLAVLVYFAANRTNPFPRRSPQGYVAPPG